MSATQIFYQEVEIQTVLDAYSRGYNPPNEGKIMKAESNYDPRTGKVWFKLYVELPSPKEKNVITLATN